MSEDIRPTIREALARFLYEYSPHYTPWKHVPEGEKELHLTGARQLLALLESLQGAPSTPPGSRVFRLILNTSREPYELGKVTAEEVLRQIHELAPHAPLDSFRVVEESQGAPSHPTPPRPMKLRAKFRRYNKTPNHGVLEFFGEGGPLAREDGHATEVGEEIAFRVNSFEGGESGNG